MAEQKKKVSSMTVFKTDRHEDVAAICLAACAVAFTLIYMAFVTPDVTVHANTSGIVKEIAVAQNATVKKGDLLYVLETTDVVWKGEVKEEVKKDKKIKSVTSGKVTEVIAKVGDKVSKNKSPIILFEHEKGTLP